MKNDYRLWIRQNVVGSGTGKCRETVIAMS